MWLSQKAECVKVKLTSSQASPEKRRLRRGETLEVSCPSAAIGVGTLRGERPLVRCHTLDSAEHPSNSLEPTSSSDPNELSEKESEPSDDSPTTRMNDDPLSAAGDQASTVVQDVHSIDVSSCSTGSETSPSPPFNASSHSDNFAEASSSHVQLNHSSSNTSNDQNIQPVNGTLSEPSDVPTPPHVDADPSDSEGKDGNSNFTVSADLHCLETSGSDGFK